MCFRRLINNYIIITAFQKFRVMFFLFYHFRWNDFKYVDIRFEKRKNIFDRIYFKKGIIYF